MFQSCIIISVEILIIASITAIFRPQNSARQKKSKACPVQQIIPNESVNLSKISWFFFCDFFVKNRSLMRYGWYLKRFFRRDFVRTSYFARRFGKYFFCRSIANREAGVEAPENQFWGIERALMFPKNFLNFETTDNGNDTETLVNNFENELNFDSRTSVF